MGIIIIVTALFQPQYHLDHTVMLIIGTAASYRSQHISYRGHSRVTLEKSNWRWVESSLTGKRQT